MKTASSRRYLGHLVLRSASPNRETVAKVTSNPRDNVRSSRRLVFLSTLDKDAGYTGGIMNEPTERTIGMCAVTTTASVHF